MAVGQLPNISKSKFLHGLQCPKLLWCDFNAKHLFPAIDEELQAVFDQGHEVGSLAKKIFPNGIEVGREPTDFEKTAELTHKYLPLRRPIFEATVSAFGGFARADILNPVGSDEWDIIEVKSTTSLKPEHILDLAFQFWVFTEAGLKIRRCFLSHINNQFVRNGEIDPTKFFTLRDVTVEVTELFRDIGKQISEMGKVIRSAKCPETQIGPHCDSPYTCPLHEHCWSFIPPHSVFDLYGDKKGRRWDLLKRNILRISEIPDDYPLSDKQEIQRAAVMSGKPHVNQTQIDAFVKNLEYPLHFLDFETFSTAIPLFDGIRPYEQIPFQFSLHIVHKAGEKPEHRKYLAEGRSDPRPEFMRELKSVIEPVGSVLVFNATFEKSRLKECAELLPEYQSWVMAVNGRIVDLLNPFKAFNFYHPNQCGSASMKSVLPALTGKDYADLDIQEGGEASREFVRVTFGDVSETERKRVWRALESYCGQDTEGMVWILDELMQSRAATQ
jgi:CRISPR/Cas system-associated exonuclease Cas4 (RecB family)